MNSGQHLVCGQLRDKGVAFVGSIKSDIHWTRTSRETFTSETLQEFVSADLAVIGGGYTGLSTALEAAERGAKVVVVEARSIGFGGSGRNVGLVNAGLWLPPAGIRRALGDAIGDRLSGILSGAPEAVFELIEKHGIECDGHRGGTLHCAHSAKGMAGLKDRFEQMEALGAPVSLLDAEETKARTGASGLYGAIFDPRAGTIQPLAYAQGLARAAQNAGVAIYEQSPALSVGWQDDKWEVATPTGLVRSPNMLLATDSYPFKMSWVQPLKSVPIYYFQVATNPLTPEQQAAVLQGGEGCWDTAMVMSSWRLDSDGRLIIGGMGQLNHVASGLHRQWIRRKIAKLYPALAEIELECIWDGRIGMTREKLPKIWRFGPGSYACFGFSGRGIAPGTVFGQRLAQCMLDRAEEVLPVIPVNENVTKYTRFRGMGFEAGAALVHSVADRF